MNHPIILSDIARFHQADLLREGQTRTMFKRAGITLSAQPKRQRAIVAFVATLILAFLIK